MWRTLALKRRREHGRREGNRGRTGKQETESRAKKGAEQTFVLMSSKTPEMLFLYSTDPHCRVPSKSMLTASMTVISKKKKVNLQKYTFKNDENGKFYVVSILL